MFKAKIVKRADLFHFLGLPPIDQIDSLTPSDAYDLHNHTLIYHKMLNSYGAVVFAKWWKHSSGVESPSKLAELENSTLYNKLKLAAEQKGINLDDLLTSISDKDRCEKPADKTEASTKERFDCYD